MNLKQQLGKSGEEFAVGLLKQNGYKIIARNYKTKLGEIDIIAGDKDTICFIEVKLRSSDRFGIPQEAVLAKKQRQISRASLLYLKDNDLLNKKARFDVVAIIYSKSKPILNLIKNAFDLDEQFIY